jgi:enoyl-CoA hydratase
MSHDPGQPDAVPTEATAPTVADFAVTPAPPALLTAHDTATRVLTLTLNRPDRLNAVSFDMYDAIVKAIRAAADDDSVRAIVVTGQGRAFCVGADLKAHAGEEPTRGDRKRYVRIAQRANRELQRCTRPVIAAVNGHAVGAGMELALSCDLIVVAEEARLRFPELALGTFVGGGVTYTLPRRIGMARASELLLLGDFFTARDALQMGLVNRVVKATEVLEMAQQLAGRVAGRAPLSVRHAKALLHTAHRFGRATALGREERALLACMDTEDWREGVRAFHERREPEYHGR